MIITKSVIVKWSGANRKWYESKGYIYTKGGDSFEIKLTDLSLKDSKRKVVIGCVNPNCKNTKEISYRTYIDRLRSGNVFLCTNCFQDGHRLDDFIHKCTDSKCKVDNCDNKEYENGLCFKHHLQMEDLGIIVPSVDHPCEVCKSEVNIQFHPKTNMYLCRKHRLQFNRNGFFQKRTIYDPNEFIIHKDYAEMELYDLVGNVIGITKIDLDDVDKAKKYKWHISDTGYVMTCIDGINLRLHKYILNQYGENYKGHDYDNMVDHIDRDKLNNKKENLRVVNDSANKQNRNTLSNSKTGRTGLNMITSPYTGKVSWKVCLFIDGKRVIDKTYSTKEKAEYVLDLHELLHKSFCPHYNELKEKYKEIYNDLIKNGIEQYI